MHLSPTWNWNPSEEENSCANIVHALVEQVSLVWFHVKQNPTLLRHIYEKADCSDLCEFGVAANLKGDMMSQFGNNAVVILWGLTAHCEIFPSYLF